MELVDQKTAKLFKAFCDPNRLMVLRLLQSGEKCACVLQDALSIPQSTLSHHMKVLCESGVVEGRKDGKWIHYSIAEKKGQEAVLLLEELLRVTPEAAVMSEGCMPCCG